MTPLEKFVSKITLSSFEIKLTPSFATNVSKVLGLMVACSYFKVCVGFRYIFLIPPLDIGSYSI